MIILALIPSIILLCVVWLSDRVESEPVGLLLALFAGGAVFSVLAYWAENGIRNGISRFFDVSFFDVSDTVFLLIKSFLIVALVEEGGKYAVMRMISWKRPAFNYTFDAIVYAVVASLGFAAVENVFYLVVRANATLDLALQRDTVSVPAHMVYGIFMGYYYGRAKRADAANDPAGRRLYTRLAMIIPILLHGLYDYLYLKPWGDYGKAFFICFVLILAAQAIWRFRKQSLRDEKIGPKV